MAEVIFTDPVTCTFRASEWHGISRDLVFVASDLTRFLQDLERGADPRRDAWVLAHYDRLNRLVERVDACVELLMETQARPVPAAGGSS
jgi:hypothetical protein